ncbi:MAG: hypothetical protein LQ337_002557 [Flavoplaca oasis]|nr:MAG: hypothetical protein LQ337_002557 [Flavoplaca oasis]
MPTSTSSSSTSSTWAGPSSTSTDLNLTNDSPDNQNGSPNSSNNNDGSSNDDGWDEDGSENDSSDSDSSNNNEVSDSNDKISNNNNNDANQNGDDGDPNDSSSNHEILSDDSSDVPNVQGSSTQNTAVMKDSTTSEIDGLDNNDNSSEESNNDDDSNEEKELKSEFASPNDNSSNDVDSNTRKMKAATTPKKQGTTMKIGATVEDALQSKNASLTGLSEGNHPILRASFTSNKLCGQTISCNAGKNNDHTGVKGIGATAVNKMLFGGPPGVYDGSGGHSNVNGLGGGCGSCWTLTPGFNYYEDNGIPLGKTVVVRINDECTDPGYCDQTPDSPLNTGPTDGIQPSGKFEAPVHFDLCEATGVAAAFFGELKTGVAMGAAQYNPDCTGLEDGEFGAKKVGDLAMPF